MKCLGVGCSNESLSPPSVFCEPNGCPNHMVGFAVKPGSLDDDGGALLPLWERIARRIEGLGEAREGGGPHMVREAMALREAGLIIRREFSGEDTPPASTALPVDSVIQHVPPGYGSLYDILIRALQQSAGGKGKERHAVEGEAFEDQQICQIPRWLGSPDAPIFQAVKKAIESKRLPKERAVAELLGAIVYLAAAVIVREETP